MHTDAQGSVVALTLPELTVTEEGINNTNGYKDNVNAYVLGPFGILDAAEVHTLHNEDAVYTGKMYDHEANLLYFHHRYYDPETKRFISEDPAAIDITDPRTINRFTFVNNNPLRFLDPDGRTPWDIVDVAVFSASAYDAYNDPSMKNLGFLALDTVALLPIIPSVGYIRHADKLMDMTDTVSTAKMAKDLTTLGKIGQSAGELSAALSYSNNLYQSYTGERSMGRLGLDSLLYFSPRGSKMGIFDSVAPSLTRLSRTDAFGSLWNAGSYGANKLLDLDFNLDSFQLQELNLYKSYSSPEGK